MARRVPLVLGLWLMALAAVTLWRDQGFVVELFSDQSAVGVAPDELATILMAAFMPAITVGALATAEYRSAPRPRLILASYVVVVALLPATTTFAWVAAVRAAQPTEAIPSVLPRALSFALIGLIGLTLTLLAGPLVGPLLSLASSVAIVLAQNAYGHGILWQAVSTGNTWQTNPWIDAVAFAGAAGYAWRRAGVPRPSV